MVDYDMIERLCTLNGISGDEGAVRDFIIKEIKPFVDSIRVDNLGNLIVHKSGKSKPKARLLLSAHMDEVGLMVTDITSDGYLKFDEVGGIDRRILPSKSVTVGANNISGVIGLKPVHLTKGDEGSSVPTMSEMYVDIGADSMEEAQKYVSIGDSINFVQSYSETDTTVKSKALDDRFGCYVLIELLKSELEYDVDASFVVQEEVGLRGAKVASYTVDPQFAIVVETTTAADVPEVEGANQVCTLGDGTVVSIMDRRTIYDKEMVKTAMALAQRIGVKAQFKRAVAGGNDAGIIHQSRGGVRTLAISLPCRYLHAPNCVVSKDDCNATLELVRAMTNEIAGGALNHEEFIL